MITNKICKVKPDKDHCCCCIDRQIDNDEYKSCELCIAEQPDSEILSLGVTFFGKEYAFVIINGKIKSVSPDRIRDIRDKKEAEPSGD